MRFNVPKAKETPKDYKKLPWTEKFRTKYPVEKVKEYMASENLKIEQLVNHLHFYCGFDRHSAELVKNVIENEINLVNNDQEVNLVINIPFCVWRCFNCTNVMYDKAKNEDVYPYFFDALLKEIEKTKEIIQNNFYIVKNIVFTGNILALEEEKIEKLLDMLNYSFCSRIVEIGALEFVEEKKLEILRKYNIDRIVFNTLTFNTSTLRKLCRRFEFKDLFEAYKKIISFGFETSFELVVGLFDENKLKIERNLKLACELGASNIDIYSCHCPYIEQENKKKDAIKTQRELLEFAHNFMQKTSYKPYFLYCSEIEDGCFENVGYTIKGKANKYLIDKINENSTTIGCGTNVFSINLKGQSGKKETLKNTYSISQYIFGIDEIIQKKVDFFNKTLYKKE